MFKWNKLGQVFNPTDVKNIDWMKEFAQTPSVLIFDSYIRVYFCSRPFPDAQGQYMSYIGFIDLDRNNLFNITNISKEPLVKFGELGTFDEFGTYPVTVIRDGDMVRLYHSSFTRCVSVPFNAAIGLAESYDNGETFTKIGSGPVLSYSYDEPFVLGSPKIRKFGDTWYLWYVSGRKWIQPEGRKPEPVYKIRVATSSDGINWLKFGKNLIEDKIDEDECQASPDVTFSNGRYHMFFSYRNSIGFKEAGKGYRIGYAVSDDLYNWTRKDELAAIDVSETGWDSETVSYGHVFELDKKLYMLYQGNQMGRYGFGLAVLEGELK